MKNKELLKLLSLEKGLVYFTTSLKSNELVMEKTLRGKIIWGWWRYTWRCYHWK